MLKRPEGATTGEIVGGHLGMVVAAGKTFTVAAGRRFFRLEDNRMC
jgi:hypothetical protein